MPLCSCTCSRPPSFVGRHGLSTANASQHRPWRFSPKSLSWITPFAIIGAVGALRCSRSPLRQLREFYWGFKSSGSRHRCRSWLGDSGTDEEPRWRGTTNQHRQLRPIQPSANSRLVHRSKRYTYSITSSAKATTADEIGVDRLQHQGDLCDYLPPARGAASKGARSDAVLSGNSCFPVDADQSFCCAWLKGVPIAFNRAFCSSSSEA